MVLMVFKSKIIGDILGKKISKKLNKIYQYALFKEFVEEIENQTVKIFPVGSIEYRDNGRTVFIDHETGQDERDVYFRYINEKIIGNNPIDFLEFGVHEGKGINFWASINQHPNSRFYGFDSFEGLPEDWTAKAPKGTFNVNGKLPEIKDNRIRFVKGMFHKTLPDFLSSYKTKNRLVIHFDADLYSSTVFVLFNLSHILGSGSVLMFDEFITYFDEFLAFHDFTRCCYKKWNVICRRRDFRRIAIELK